MEASVINLEDIESWEEIPMEEVFDIEVEQNHNFYIATNSSPILVHNSGKSEFIDFIYSKLNVLFGWKIGYYSPESMPLSLHYSRLFAKFVGKKHQKGIVTNAEKETGRDYINDNVFWVAPEMDFKTDEILARFEYLVKAKGCKAFVIDPFNRIEAEASHSENERLYIKKTLGKLISFAKRTDSLLLLIAHPTKLRKDEKGKFPMPSMYDISGSADFWNMVDYGIAVRREQDEQGKFLTFGQVNIAKTKYNETMGSTGLWNFRYNINNGRYVWDDIDTAASPIHDNSNWITKEEYKEPEEKPLPLISIQQAFSSEDTNWEDEFDY